MNWQEFVNKAGKQEEPGALVFRVYSFPCWAEFTVDFYRLTHFSEQEHIAQGWTKPLHVSVYMNPPLAEAFILTINLTKTYLKSSRDQLVHILHSNL